MYILGTAGTFLWSAVPKSQQVNVKLLWVVRAWNQKPRSSTGRHCWDNDELISLHLSLTMSRCPCPHKGQANKCLVHKTEQVESQEDCRWPPACPEESEEKDEDSRLQKNVLDKVLQ